MSTRERNWWIVAGIAIVLYALFPIAWIVSLSFKAPADIANGVLGNDDIVVFWHTGGIPAVFAYAAEIAAEFVDR